MKADHGRCASGRQHQYDVWFCLSEFVPEQFGDLSGRQTDLDRRLYPYRSKVLRKRDYVMAVVCSIIIGYLLGCISPAALVSKIKNKDLRKSGTGNLGATNTLLVFGKSWGVCVMLFDVAKAFTACKLARWLFPSLPIAGMLAGSAAVAGHIYPFYMKFRGGKVWLRSQA